MTARERAQALIGATALLFLAAAFSLARAEELPQVPDPAAHVTTGFAQVMSGLGHMVTGFAWPVTAPGCLAAGTCGEWNCQTMAKGHWCHRAIARNRSR